MKRIKSNGEVLKQPKGTVFNVYLPTFDINFIGESISFVLYGDEIVSIEIGDPEKDLTHNYLVNAHSDVVYILDVIN